MSEEEEVSSTTFKLSLLNNNSSQPQERPQHGGEFTVTVNPQVCTVGDLKSLACVTFGLANDSPIRLFATKERHEEMFGHLDEDEPLVGRVHSEVTLFVQQILPSTHAAASIAAPQVEEQVQQAQQVQQVEEGGCASPVVVDTINNARNDSSSASSPSSISPLLSLNASRSCSWSHDENDAALHNVTHHPHRSKSQLEKHDRRQEYSRNNSKHSASRRRRRRRKSKKHDTQVDIVIVDDDDNHDNNNNKQLHAEDGGSPTSTATAFSSKHKHAVPPPPPHAVTPPPPPPFLEHSPETNNTENHNHATPMVLSSSPSSASASNSNSSPNVIQRKRPKLKKASSTMHAHTHDNSMMHSPNKSKPKQPKKSKSMSALDNHHHHQKSPIIARGRLSPYKFRNGKCSCACICLFAAASFLTPLPPNPNQDNQKHSKQVQWVDLNTLSSHQLDQIVRGGMHAFQCIKQSLLPNNNHNHNHNIHKLSSSLSPQSPQSKSKPQQECGEGGGRVSPSTAWMLYKVEQLWQHEALKPWLEKLQCGEAISTPAPATLVTAAAMDGNSKNSHGHGHGNGHGSYGEGVDEGHFLGITQALQQAIHYGHATHTSRVAVLATVESKAVLCIVDCSLPPNNNNNNNTHANSTVTSLTNSSPSSEGTWYLFCHGKRKHETSSERIVCLKRLHSLLAMAQELHRLFYYIPPSPTATSTTTPSSPSPSTSASGNPEEEEEEEEGYRDATTTSPTRQRGCHFRRSNSRKKNKLMEGITIWPIVNKPTNHACSQEGGKLEVEDGLQQQGKPQQVVVVVDDDEEDEDSFVPNNTPTPMEACVSEPEGTPRATNATAIATSAAAEIITEKELVKLDTTSPKLEKAKKKSTRKLDKEEKMGAVMRNQETVGGDCTPASPSASLPGMKLSPKGKAGTCIQAPEQAQAQAQAQGQAQELVQAQAHGQAKAQAQAQEKLLGQAQTHAQAQAQAQVPEQAPPPPPNLPSYFSMDDFLDPLMYEVMADPVSCEDGYTYERANIERHFQARMEAEQARQHAERSQQQNQQQNQEELKVEQNEEQGSSSNTTAPTCNGSNIYESIQLTSPLTNATISNLLVPNMILEKQIVRLVEANALGMSPLEITKWRQRREDKKKRDAQRAEERKKWEERQEKQRRERREAERRRVAERLLFGRRGGRGGVGNVNNGDAAGGALVTLQGGKANAHVVQVRTPQKNHSDSAVQAEHLYLAVALCDVSTRTPIEYATQTMGGTPRCMVAFCAKRLMVSKSIKPNQNHRIEGSGNAITVNGHDHCHDNKNVYQWCARCGRLACANCLQFFVSNIANGQEQLASATHAVCGECMLDLCDLLEMQQQQQQQQQQPQNGTNNKDSHLLVMKVKHQLTQYMDQMVSRAIELQNQVARYGVEADLLPPIATVTAEVKEAMTSFEEQRQQAIEEATACPVVGWNGLLIRNYEEDDVEDDSTVGTLGTAGTMGTAGSNWVWPECQAQDLDDLDAGYDTSSNTAEVEAADRRVAFSLAQMEYVRDLERQQEKLLSKRIPGDERGQLLHATELSELSVKLKAAQRELENMQHQTAAAASVATAAGAGPSSTRDVQGNKPHRPLPTRPPPPPQPTTKFEIPPNVVTFIDTLQKKIILRQERKRKASSAKFIFASSRRKLQVKLKAMQDVLNEVLTESTALEDVGQNYNDWLSMQGGAIASREAATTELVGRLCPMLRALHSVPKRLRWIGKDAELVELYHKAEEDVRRVRDLIASESPLRRGGNRVGGGGGGGEAKVGERRPSVTMEVKDAPPPPEDPKAVEEELQRMSSVDVSALASEDEQTAHLLRLSSLEESFRLNKQRSWVPLSDSSDAEVEQICNNNKSRRSHSAPTTPPPHEHDKVEKRPRFTDEMQKEYCRLSSVNLAALSADDAMTHLMRLSEIEAKMHTAEEAMLTPGIQDTKSGVGPLLSSLWNEELEIKLTSFSRRVRNIEEKIKVAAVTTGGTAADEETLRREEEEFIAWRKDLDALGKHDQDWPLPLGLSYPTASMNRKLERMKAALNVQLCQSQRSVDQELSAIMKELCMLRDEVEKEVYQYQQRVRQEVQNSTFPSETMEQQQQKQQQRRRRRNPNMAYLQRERLRSERERRAKEEEAALCQKHLQDEAATRAAYMRATGQEAGAAVFGGRGDFRMCGHCKAGPIENVACTDLAMHNDGAIMYNGQAVMGKDKPNHCPNCGWFDGHWHNWPIWDGIEGPH